MRHTSSGGGERIAARGVARCACSGPADSQPMASDTSTPSWLLTCQRVLQCGSTWVAGVANTRAACVTSVLCTRVVVCRAQRGERGRDGGEDDARAMPVREMPLGGTGLQLCFCTVQNALLAYAKQAEIVPCSVPQPGLAAAAEHTPLLPVGDAPVRVTAHAI